MEGWDADGHAFCGIVKKILVLVDSKKKFDK